MRVQIKGFNLALTAASGQSFRFNQMSPGCFSLVAMNRSLVISGLGEDTFEFSCGQEEFEQIWRHYFDLGRDYGEIHRLGTGSDRYLQKAIAYAAGVRILRQEFFETLISFIVSQRKSIPAIKACVEALSARFGTPLKGGCYAFPLPEALMEADEKDLAACGLGYRVRYVQQTAAMICREGADAYRLAALDDRGLQATLLRFPGVGVKVAACVMLFAFQRMDSFPVDVWIKRVLDNEYPGGFPFEQYHGVLGILQQYLFCYARWEASAGKQGKLVI